MDEASLPAGMKKSLYRSEALHKYILKTSVLPRENETLKKLREATDAAHKQAFGVYRFLGCIIKGNGDGDGGDPFIHYARSLMSVPPEEGQLISLLLKLINASKTVEIGVFTGYSLLVTALALPEDGKITAIDHDLEGYKIGLPFIKEAGVHHKVNFIHGEALPILDELLEKEGEEGTYDFAFVDADKINYPHYHDRLKKLVRVGGLIAYDNTLWFGSVVEPEMFSDVLFFDRVRQQTLAFNAMLASDHQINISHIYIGDGLTLCFRIR